MDFTKMCDEVWEWAHTKGWEPDTDRPFDDECVLMISEVIEALEAYRTHKFGDATDHLAAKALAYPDLDLAIAKPEGVGSELADVLVRLCHYAKRRGFTIEMDHPVKLKSITFGTECMQMCKEITAASVLYSMDRKSGVERVLSALLSLLIQSCELHGFDLEWEFRRKMDYNKTRSYRHGNRAM